MPSGAHLTENFYYAGGTPALIKPLAGRLRLGALTVTGGTVGDDIADAEVHNDVIRPLDNPLVEAAGLVILGGNLAPGGAVLKPSAATPELLEYVACSVVFDGTDDYRRRIADPALPIDATSVMVLRNCEPRGYPGMAEVGNMGLPPKLLEQGVRDLVRIRTRA